MKKIRTGIIGVGNMGSTHAKNILDGKCPELELVAVADIDPGRLQWCAEKSGELRCFESADAMLESGLLDACIVAVPHYQHPDWAIKCFDRHIHVMVEKPAGVYTAQVRRMNEAAEKSGVVFGMMFNQRTNSMYRKMRELMQSGELGALHRVSWIITDWYRAQLYYDSGDWRATWRGEGGGVLLNQCPHQLDLLQWICGMPARVEAKLHFGKWHDIEVEDDVTAYLEYPGGATGLFVTTTGDCPGTNRFEVTCEKGRMVAEGKELKITRLKTALDSFRADTVFGKPEYTDETITYPDQGLQHIGVLNSFASCILKGTPLIAGGEEGLDGLMLSNAMHLSAFTGKAVSLPIDDQLYYRELMKRVKASGKKVTGQSILADVAGTY